MGWSSGTYLAGDIIAGLKDVGFDFETRSTVYRVLIPAMEQADWDTQSECEGSDPAFDAVLRELHPKWYEGE